MAESYNTSIPAENAFDITPNDSSDLSIVPRALYIGGAGDVKVDMVGSGSAITFVGVQAGTLLPVRAKRVYSTDTTATSILGVY